jgi:hypothetical protein
VTVLSGFLGTGMTALLNRMLSWRRLPDPFQSIGIDAMISIAPQTGTGRNGGWLLGDRGASHIVNCPTRTVLAHILRPGINLAVWRRSVPAPIAAWLQAYSLEDRSLLTSDLDLRIPAACVPGELATAIAHPAISDRTGISALVSDVADLAKVVARIAGQPNVRVRLEWVTDQQCAYFHSDRVPYRLVCTYRGAGTEWVSNETASRLTSPESEPPADEIHQLASGDVAIMRGSLRGTESTPPLLHRSPPVVSASAARLFLAIEPIASSKSAR